MAHYAKLDENNIVLDVNIVRNQDCLDLNGQESEEVAIAFLEANGHLGRWVKTSYNTYGNVHFNPETGEPDDGIPFRGNYAGIGSIYDETNDVFYGPQPFPSWTISAETNWIWVAPIPKPTYDISKEICVWNEDTKNWIRIIGETRL
jgi:hypothetical protein